MIGRFARGVRVLLCFLTTTPGRWGMHRQRDFLSLVVIAAAVVTSAWGQIGVPTAGPASVQTAASIPDFSGIWGHPYLPGFEPPLSGPGPVVNKSRRRQIFGTDGPL